MLSSKVICVKYLSSLIHSASCLSLPLFLPQHNCMLAGSDLAWGAIVLNLIKQWINASDVKRALCCCWCISLQLWTASSCGCLIPLVEKSMSEKLCEHDMHFSVKICVWKWCWLKPLDGDVIPFFTATQVLCGPTVETVVGIWKPDIWMWLLTFSLIHCRWWAPCQIKQTCSASTSWKADILTPLHRERPFSVFSLIFISLYADLPSANASPTVGWHQHVGGEIQINKILYWVPTSWVICF